MQGAASDRTLISSGLFFAPAKLNIHKTLPRMSYEPLTYARSISSCAQLAILQVNIAQPAFTCSKLTIETLEQRVKYV